jgi:hypothetical protein
MLSEEHPDNLNASTTPTIPAQRGDVRRRRDRAGTAPRKLTSSLRYAAELPRKVVIDDTANFTSGLKVSSLQQAVCAQGADARRATRQQ